MAANSAITLPTGTIPVETPMRGSVVSIDVTVGERIHKGQTLATLEAMKMHHLVEAPASGEVALIYAEPGATLDESSPMLAIYPGEADEDEGGATHAVDLDATALTSTKSTHATRWGWMRTAQTRSLSDARLAGALPAKTWPTWWTRAVSLNTAR